MKSYTTIDIHIGDDVIQVEFIGNVITEDSPVGSYPVVDHIEWDKNMYCDHVNALIMGYMQNNREEIEEVMLRKD